MATNNFPESFYYKRRCHRKSSVPKTLRIRCPGEKDLFRPALIPHAFRKSPRTRVSVNSSTTESTSVPLPLHVNHL